MIRSKPVITPGTPDRPGVFWGFARTWADVALLLNDTREGAGAQLSREHAEGPSAFFLKELRR